MRDSVHTNRVVIEGETWVAYLTPEEYQEWIKYDNAHPQLSPLPVQSILEMFLNHFRRGVNLNQPLKP